MDIGRDDLRVVRADPFHRTRSTRRWTLPVFSPRLCGVAAEVEDVAAFEEGIDLGVLRLTFSYLAGASIHPLFANSYFSPENPVASSGCSSRLFLP